jgi:hypothetical protein
MIYCACDASNHQELKRLNRRLTSKIMQGALAGTAGAMAMHAFRLCWESATGHKPEHGIFGFDREADINSAQLLAKLLLRRNVSESAAERIGISLHYCYGAVVGASYSCIALRTPQARKGFGTAFGMVRWLAGDELPIAILGISDPRSKTAASHAAALAAHLLFGTVVEGVVRATR